jgi:hypothetical protein
MEPQVPANIKRPAQLFRNVQQQCSFLSALIALLVLSSTLHLQVVVAEFDLMFPGRRSLKKRKRGRMEDIVEALGPTYFWHAYQMDINKFYELVVSMLSPKLKQSRVGPNGKISVAL